MVVVMLMTTTATMVMLVMMFVIMMMLMTMTMFTFAMMLMFHFFHNLAILLVCLLFSNAKLQKGFCNPVANAIFHQILGYSKYLS